MINCMGAEEMAYFISLLDHIVSVLGAVGDTIIIHAEQGDVVWQRSGDVFCKVISTES